MFFFEGDLTDEEDVRRIFHSSLSFFGRIDVLINNAGILEQGTIENTSLDQLDRMMKTNVRYNKFLTSTLTGSVEVLVSLQFHVPANYVGCSASD